MISFGSMAAFLIGLTWVIILLDLCKKNPMKKMS